MNAEKLKDYNFLKSKTIDEIYSLFDGLSDTEKRSVINNKSFLEKLSENEVYDLLNGLSEDDYFIILHNPYFLYFTDFFYHITSKITWAVFYSSLSVSENRVFHFMLTNKNKSDTIRLSAMKTILKSV